MSNYDVAVLGIGGMGSAALASCATAGLRTIGFDRFVPPHPFGSSHGQTRVIRLAYFEHPDYTPLLVTCYDLWSELERKLGQSLYYQVGVLQIGPESGVVVPGIRRAAEAHGLAVEEFSRDAIQARWPLLHPLAGCVGILETRAGYLHVERCVQGYLDVARAAGAEIASPCEALSWRSGSPIRVLTATGEIAADRLIITAGAWANQVLADLSLQFEVRRKSLFWFAERQSFASDRFPCFLFEQPDGIFYGFPAIDSAGIKVAEHTGGQVVDNPLEVDREVDAEDESRVLDFCSSCLPGVTGERLDHQTCLYTMSPDGHFIVDRHPYAENVVFAAGLSGHGFKFAPALGRALAEMVIDGGTDLPVDFLSLQRLKPS